MKRHLEKSALICLGLMLVSGWAHALPAPSTQVSSADKTPKSVELKADPRKVPDELDGVGIKEHLGDKLDLASLEFTDSEDAQKHKLQEFFSGGKPVLINLVYFECPMLCTMVLNGVKDGMKNLIWSIGKEYNVVTISINPNDSLNMAKFKRQNYLKSYLEKEEGQASHDGTAASQGWHFLTGSQDQIKKIADQLGFEYKYDSIQKQYAHPAVTFVLTPEGAISRYLYGITYEPKNLKLALLEASRGKIGSVFDRLLMFCYHYEPNSRGYAVQAFRVMQAGGLLIIAMLGGYLTVFWTRQRKGKTK